MAPHEQPGELLQDLDANGQAAQNESSDDDSNITFESSHKIRTTGMLNTFDVFSLIVNKMIGTGIYSAPATVLVLTGNKSLTLGLFAIGFLYSILSMFLYLDYAAAFPYTGGELVYIDELTAYSGREKPIISETTTSPNDAEGNTEPPPPPAPSAKAKPSSTKQRLKRWLHKLSGDGLLGYVAYSLLFVSIFNSGTNSMQTGRMILICIQARPGPEQPPLNGDLIRFIGVVTLTTLCLIQYFSAETGRILNRYLAVVKIIFLFILIIGGAAKTAQNLEGVDSNNKAIKSKAEWHEWYDTKSDLNFAKALLAVLFAFEGWENATFVAGEVPQNKHNSLRNGFMFAVTVVGILYLCVASVVLDAIPYSHINGIGGGGQNVFYAPMLFDNSPTARRAWAILAAISSLGSLNSIIYTFSRVKQSIGQANILPWSRIWSVDDPIHRDDKHNIRHKTPQGGLILHWIMSVVVIAGSSDLSNVIESVSLPGYLQTYTHCFILMIMSLLFLRLRAREKLLNRKPPTDILIRPSQWTGIARFVLAIILIIYSAANAAILIINVIPPYRASDGKDSSFPGYGFLAIMFSVIAFGMVYYFFVFGASLRYFPAGRVEDVMVNDHDDEEVEGESEEGESVEVPKLKERGIYKASRWWNVLGWVHVKAEVRKDYSYNEDLERVHRFGRRWRVRWILEDQYRHPGTEGLITTNGDGGSGSGSIKVYANVLYWFFGGSRWLDKKRTPWGRIKARKRRIDEWFERIRGGSEE